MCYEYSASAKTSYIMLMWGFYEAGRGADALVWFKDLTNITSMPDLNWVGCVPYPKFPHFAACRRGPRTAQSARAIVTN